MGHQWIPLTNTSDKELWWFFYLRLNKLLSKPSRRRWSETQSRSLWRHCNEQYFTAVTQAIYIIYLRWGIPYSTWVPSEWGKTTVLCIFLSSIEIYSPIFSSWNHWESPLFFRCTLWCVSCQNDYNLSTMEKRQTTDNVNQINKAG